MEVTIVSKDGSKWKSILEKNDILRKYTGWRCLHQAEGGYPNPDKMPVVRRSIQGLSVNFTRSLQLMSYGINGFNSLFTKTRWMSTYGYKTAFTNQNGFGDPSDPRADYVNMENLKYPLPKLMNGIICGGSFYTGVVSYSLSYSLSEFVENVKIAFRGKNELVSKRSLLKRAFIVATDTTSNIITMRPGIDAVDVNNYPADIQEFSRTVLDNVWYFTATTRSGDVINNFPQGMGRPVYIPYCLSSPASYPLSWFEPWDEYYLPDPLKIYNPLP